MGRPEAASSAVGLRVIKPLAQGCVSREILHNICILFWTEIKFIGSGSVNVKTHLSLLSHFCTEPLWAL